MIPQLPADMHYQFARELTQARQHDVAQQESRVMVFLRFSQRRIRALSFGSTNVKPASVPTSMKPKTASAR